MKIQIDLLCKIIASLTLITFFYSYIKSFVFHYSGKLAILLNINSRYPYETAKGVIELCLIVFLHFIFCWILIGISGVSFYQLGLSLSISPILLFNGFLLGIGIMGTASLLGRFYIESMRFFFQTLFPNDLKNWLTIARGGWIRHHFHTLEVFPIPLALCITLGQVCAEEIVFRGVCINYFIKYGEMVALSVSTLLFMYMQVFHMPNKTSAMFPIIGAFVFGIVSGFLYLNFHSLMPLIIAHITFFSVAVL